MMELGFNRAQNLPLESHRIQKSNGGISDRGVRRQPLGPAIGILG